MKDASELVRFAKGTIGPTAIAVSGQLRPEQAQRLISLVFEDELFKRITTRTMRKLKADVQVFDIPNRQLLRITEGSEPADNQLLNLQEYGCTLDALAVQLYPTITLGFIIDNQDNPNLEKEIEASIVKKFRSELVDLGVNGTADNNASGFLSLNKGWIKIADDNVSAVKVTINIPTDGVKTTLQALLNAMDSRFRQGAEFFMSVANADKYAAEVAETYGVPVTDAAARKYLGYMITPVQTWPENYIMFTQPTNLVVGVAQDITREREYHSRKRAVEWTFNAYVDFELVIKQAVVLGKPA